MSASRRGRPRKVEELAAGISPASSRASSSRRSSRLSTGGESKLFAGLPPAKSRAASAVPSIVTSIADSETTTDFPSPSALGTFTSTKKEKAKAAEEAGRESLSSVATSNEDAESPGYSTPGTSAIATPNTEIVAKPPVKRRPGRPSRPSLTVEEAMDVDTPPETGLSTIAQARALRNSKFALGSSLKRKRPVSDDDDEDEDARIQADAQVARALQAEEDELAAAEGLGSVSPRSTRKTARKILPKTDYVVDSESENDSDLIVADMVWPTRSAKKAASKKIASSSTKSFEFKKPKIELGPKGSNEITFKSNSSKTNRKFLDSDDTDEFLEIDDSEDDSDARPIGITPRSQKIASFNSKGTLPKKSSSFKIPTRPIASTARVSSHFPKVKAETKPSLLGEDSSGLSSLDTAATTDSELDSENIYFDGLSTDGSDFETDDDGDTPAVPGPPSAPGLSRGSRMGAARRRINYLEDRQSRRGRQERQRLELHHPELHTMWKDLENLPKLANVKAEQPNNINRELKPFQLEGLSWMKAMEDTEWGGGLLGDEMGMGKTIQAVSLIMSDWPAKQPSLVLIPPVALMQWQQEIADYTDGTLKTFVFHGQNSKTKTMTKADLMKYNVILMSYNSLESMYRKQEKGFKRKNGMHKEKSVIHQIQFHRVILDEAHNIKQRTTGSAKACFALKADHKWCLSGTPLQNRIGEFFSLVRFLDIRPFACYFCKQCPCSTLNWEMNSDNRCTGCNHSGMQHVSVFNQELLNPIQKFGNKGPGKEAFRKLRLLTDRFMLRRVKRDHSAAMELPAKEIYVDRHFFGEEENDFAGSIMNNGTRKFETYVAQGVLLNNYANIFGLIMQMRQVADHPDLILKKNTEGGQNILVCCICDETAEEAIRSACKHDFCRECAKNYLRSSDAPDCPQCHIPLSIDLEQPDIEQDEQLVKKSSIINRIKMENWTSSSKIEALVHNLHELRSKNSTTKSIIFSQFTTMLQLVEWRLRRAGITTVLLDGSMTPAQRQSSINHFMTNVNVECFLVSLKAGGVALNLTEASHVFIVDPWWNPAAEWQSADRCHRIGQARPCSITRLCIEDSVESRMVLLQEKKANMINSTINADETAMESLTPEDMQFLFRGN